ncbi:hypothetical protein GLOIN_2v1781201 [Rhizophagus irregularis DAOM 181602=DAOM 197198]|uniref:Uncharacterized protein n=1 Tax=Rhizophagus irregularis (strain DAOM 181602 / DAOM 197198 / MUCL 43194) TaxID=747089 RepID=A0A2P4PKK7_RHIID|nr:hypothetical protein GLOIN_2v1781201 [Rhizophagus irregularis DAOM 181602=DAOM 197198]POG65933.1 hypothetical protein GLOIN_2v1781201 [Rhizophagus irregularis DAOM 181602=DAOM 197198]|eukprot:XP_025172799.1 hypothetical protein GLOIN_2v1781201 [Rhizophagus irregularis DAOM 181602=DAOM 197198]
MSNVHTLKDIKNRGHRLGSAYEQELEKKLRTAIDFNSEITDFNEKLQAEISEYSEREEEFQRSYADIVNKTSQLNASSTKVRSQLISERKSHSESQQRGATLAQKASSADKVQILFLETKIRELEGKLEDIDLERTYHDLDAMGGKLAQISSSNPKEIDSLRLELEQVKEDRNSKEYTIECMEKGIESSNSIFRQEIDALYSARSKLREENRAFKDQLALKKNTSSQIISSEGDSFGIGWRRSSTIVPRNTSSTGYSCRCEFSNVSDDNIFYACLTTDCGYMARGQEMVESMGYE